MHALDFIQQKFIYFIIFFYIVTRSLFIQYIPIWDAHAYYVDCMLYAVNTPFSINNFSCAGHPSIVFALLIAIFAYFDPGNTYLYHIPLILLGVGTIIIFYKLLTFILRKSMDRNEINLLTLLFAWYPFIYAIPISTRFATLDR